MTRFGATNPRGTRRHICSATHPDGLAGAFALRDASTRAAGVTVDGLGAGADQAIPPGRLFEGKGDEFEKRLTTAFEVDKGGQREDSNKYGVVTVPFLFEWTRLERERQHRLLLSATAAQSPITGE